MLFETLNVTFVIPFLRVTLCSDIPGKSAETCSVYVCMYAYIYIYLYSIQMLLLAVNVFSLVHSAKLSAARATE